MNILEFANPIGWWWAALAVPLALLYVLKVRLRRQPSVPFCFGIRSFKRKSHARGGNSLRHLLSLLLQLALLALLVLALVDPLWQWQKAQRRKVLVVVDNSASMATKKMANRVWSALKKQHPPWCAACAWAMRWRSWLPVANPKWPSA